MKKANKTLAGIIADSKPENTMLLSGKWRPGEPKYYLLRVKPLASLLRACFVITGRALQLAKGWGGAQQVLVCASAM